MAAAITITTNEVTLKNKKVREIIADWTADSFGNLATSLGSHSGFIESVITIAGASGDLTTNLATACHMFIHDKFSTDIMGFALYNRSSSLPQRNIASFPTFVTGDLELNVSTTGPYLYTRPKGLSGDAQGRCIIYLTM
jgi:hypothetical protein